MGHLGMFGSACDQVWQMFGSACDQVWQMGVNLSGVSHY